MIGGPRTSSRAIHHVYKSRQSAQSLIKDKTKKRTHRLVTGSYAPSGSLRYAATSCSPSAAPMSCPWSSASRAALEAEAAVAASAAACPSPMPTRLACLAAMAYLTHKSSAPLQAATAHASAPARSAYPAPPLRPYVRPQPSTAADPSQKDSNPWSGSECAYPS